jgi:Chaperone of endosialidase
MGIFDIFGTGDQQAAAQSQIAGLNAGYSQLTDQFNQGRGALNTNYAAALAPLTAQQGTNTAGSNQLASLLGFGPQGSAGIQNTLQNLPGYQFALDQGSQNVMRNQASTGQLNSGATDTALTQYGQGLASQNYNNYVNQLQPFLGAANTGAANIAGVNTGLGNQLNQSYQTQGNAAYGTQAGIGNANAQANLAGLTQSGNIFGALTGGLAGALKLSDKHAKDDIEKVGELFDGQNVYRYRYKGSPRHEIGLIAQEVEDREPGAVVTFGPLKAVNYKHATNYAAELGYMREAA